MPPDSRQIVYEHFAELGAKNTKLYKIFRPLLLHVLSLIPRFPPVFLGRSLSTKLHIQYIHSHVTHIHVTHTYVTHTHITCTHSHHTPSCHMHTHTHVTHPHTGEDIFSSGGGGSKTSRDDDDLFAELDQNKPMSPLGKSIKASVSIWEEGRERGGREGEWGKGGREGGEGRERGGEGRERGGGEGREEEKKRRENKRGNRN